ncbi:MAG: TVP38/TMEM64 family protein [Gammaproteobacteria bacterium]|nr:TVP38/TMEM64 family protein [Gammaproteobacteria bacterium]
MKEKDEYLIFLFWLVNFIAVLLFIPLTLFWIIAGLLFGTLTGTILTASASTAAATVAFLLGRRYEELFNQLINRNVNTMKLKDKIENKMDQNSFTVLFIIRVLPHPFILFSYIAGFSKAIHINIYVLATFLAIVPLSFSFVLLGDSLLNNVKIIIIPIVLILLITQLPKVIKKLTNINF